VLPLLSMLTQAHATDGVFSCIRTDTGGYEKGRTLALGEGWLFSVDNDNQRYRLMLELLLPPDSWACLTIGGRLIAATSVGQDMLATSASFELTPAEASILSSRLSIPRKDRTRLDEGLQVRFESADWTVGGAMVVVITLENRGDAPVAITLGGRYRGAGRDNRFSFVVTGPSGALPDIGTDMDLGGLSTWAVLAPGEHLQVQEDVSRWTVLAVPGTYTVDCSFDLELSVPRDGFSMAYAHERWERTVASSLTVMVGL
jgi:hypothetical protein